MGVAVELGPVGLLGATPTGCGSADRTPAQRVAGQTPDRSPHSAHLTCHLASHRGCEPSGVVRTSHPRATCGGCAPPGGHVSRTQLPCTEVRPAHCEPSLPASLPWSSSPPHSQKNRQTIWQTVWRDRDSFPNCLLK
eukprot:5182305-Prymnesium_polylepis.1